MRNKSNRNTQPNKKISNKNILYTITNTNNTNYIYIHTQR